MMIEKEIKINSFNCRGLRNVIKRKNIFQWIKSNYYGITLLQETHSVLEDENTWENEWGGDIYFSHGTRNSRGVAILLPPYKNWDIKYINGIKDNLGRIFLLHCEIESNEFIIINVYAPTKDNHNLQLEFLESLTVLIHENSEKSLIIGGDFNTYLNPLMDKLGGKNECITNYAEKLIALCEDISLVDIWRIRNKKQQQFTRRENSKNGLIHSRIDFWLISKNLEYQTTKVDIHPGNCSDHSIISISLRLGNTITRGKGNWKFPNNLLHDKLYVDKIKTLILQTKNENKFNDKNMQWEFIKCIIRTETIDFCRKKAKTEREKEKYLENRILEMENIVIKEGDESYQEYLLTKTEWENIQKVKTNGIIMRSKANWVENGEKNTKYFLNLEKRNFNIKYIKSLIKKDNKLTYNHDEIMEEQYNFYKDLYSSKHKDSKKLENFLTKEEKTKVPQLTPNQKELCDTPLDISELALALKELVNDKSPGSDGFTTNFYKFFWTDIKDILYESYLYSFENKRLSQSQRIGIINLIPKKDKDIRFLKNWRPVSLLNTDYKILTKALAIRLQKVISNLVHTDQVGYIKGRNIGENIRTIADIIECTRLSNIPGMIALIDFEKAFDSIEWDFLFDTLKLFNFGEDFIRWIKILYTDITACTTNNGYNSKFFVLSRSIRQGCPISALLFILVAETLAIKIRACENIKGIILENHEFKLNQLADDTSLFLNDMSSLINAIELLQKFEKHAGLKLNIEKTEVIPIGTLTNKTFTLPKQLQKIKINFNSFQTLGVWFSHNIKEIVKLNFEDRLKKMNILINIWSSRNLSWKGKITIIKSQLVPQFQHLLSLLFIPNYMIKALDTLLLNFLWNKKPARIKKETICDSLENGGLTMPDIKIMHDSAKISMFKRLISDSTSKWKALTWKLLNNDKHTLTKNVNAKALNKPLTEYHIQLLSSWLLLKHREPSTVNEVLNEYLCENSFIILNSCIKKLIHPHLKIIDLLNTEKQFYNLQELNNKYNYNLNFLQYRSIITAIPKKWIDIICINTGTKFNKIDDFSVKIKNKYKLLVLTKQKEIYWELVNRSRDQTPTSVEKWHELFPFLENLDWAYFRVLPHRIMREPYIQTFQYKVLNRTIACRYNLFKWQIKTDPMCSYCNEIDTIEHHLFYCITSLDFWKKVERWIDGILSIKYQFKICEILLGIIDNNDPVLETLNFVIIMGKLHIYKAKQNHSPIIFLNFLINLKTHLHALELIYEKENKTDLYNKKFGIILNDL